MSDPDEPGEELVHPGTTVTTEPPPPPGETDETRSLAWRFARDTLLLLVLLGIGVPVVLLGVRLLADDPVTVSPARSRPATLSTGSVLMLGGGLSPPDEAAVLRALGVPGAVRDGPRAGFAAGRPSLTSLFAEGTYPRDLSGVVVQAGAADEATGAAQLTLAAEQLADRIRTASDGSTSIVFVGPVPAASGPTPALVATRDVLREAARVKKVHFLDPVTLGLTVEQSDLAQRLADVIRPELTQR